MSGFASFLIASHRHKSACPATLNQFACLFWFHYTNIQPKAQKQKSKYQVCFISHMIVRMIVENNFDLDQPQRGLGGACRRLPRLDNRPRHLHPHRPLLPAQVFILSSDAILLIVLPLSFLHIVTMRLNCRCVISLVVTYNLQLSTCKHQ